MSKKHKKMKVVDAKTTDGFANFSARMGLGADKFREYLVESELTNATLREEITLAINSVLSEAKGAIPSTALVSLVRAALGRAQDVDTYTVDSEMVKEVLKSSVYM